MGRRAVCHRRTRARRWWLGLLMWTMAVPAWAAPGLRPVAAGVRFGVFSAPRDQNFTQSEGFGRWALPWRWRLPAGLVVTPQLDVAAGVLRARGETGFIGSAGPVLLLSLGPERNARVFLEFGVKATVLSRYRFGAKNLGGPYAFSDHLGAGLRFGPRRQFLVGYRFQHLSNLDLYRNNPGVNEHMVTFGYHF